MATHSSILAWKIPWTEEPGRATVHGVANIWTRLSYFTFLYVNSQTVVVILSRDPWWNKVDCWPHPVLKHGNDR